MNKVFLDNLPQDYNEKTNKKVIHWSKIVGLFIFFIYNNIKGTMEIVKYNKKGYLTVKYNNRLFDISIASIYGCNLGKILGTVTSEFKIEIGENIKDNKRDITITNRKIIQKENTDKLGRKSIAKEKWYQYHCNECGFECGEYYYQQEYKEEYWIIESSLLNNSGCACCSNPSKIVVVGYNDIPTTAPWMIKYFQGGYDEAKKYTRRSREEIIPICPDCGQIKDKKMRIQNIYLRKSIGCKKCSDNISYPSKIMFNILEQLQIDFETEYNPEWCKYLFKDKPRRGLYDFYFKLNDKKYITEMDGAWHTNDNNISGQTKMESKYIDDEKDRLAIEHRIEKPIRIDSEISDLEYIKQNILKSKLNELFNLSKIDWKKVEEFALSNLVKVACEYKNNNTDLTTRDIGKTMKLSISTIIDYLKKGSSIGWCNYNVKEERVKSSIHNGKANGKSVEMFNKNGISLGIFSSCAELGRKSLELFGVNLNASGIARVCTGERKQYKNYTFLYI